MLVEPKAFIAFVGRSQVAPRQQHDFRAALCPGVVQNKDHQFFGEAAAAKVFVGHDMLNHAIAAAAPDEGRRNGEDARSCYPAFNLDSKVVAAGVALYFTPYLLNLVRGQWRQIFRRRVMRIERDKFVKVRLLNKADDLGVGHLFVAIGDPTFRQIIRGHLDRNFVARQHANSESAHFA